MFAQTLSAALWGISAKQVQVEVDASRGLPAFLIVGLPDMAVKESRDRVLAALKNSEFTLPPRRVTVNLAPAHLRKEGPAFDLPIALALLAATEFLSPTALQGHLILGELSLDGRICPVRGALSLVNAARTAGVKKIILPLENAPEVALLQDLAILGAKTLAEVVDYFCGKTTLTQVQADASQWFSQRKTSLPAWDFSDVRGQQHAKRALEIAACGGHNVLMIGPPGSGKTMLAQRLPGILPEFTLNEALETTQVHSICGLLAPHACWVVTRPFRSPHHTISDVALIGGGSYPKPGEVSLAHNGVLFLDELPEFSKNALEVLRQPLEDHTVTISRISAALTYPSRFMLVAAMNPCPCGYYTDPIRECRCTLHQIQKYLSRVSGPLLDRFDIHLDVPALSYQELTSPTDAESSEAIRERVQCARNLQLQRFHNHSGMTTNSQLSPRLLRQYCRLTEPGHVLIKSAIERLGLSARAYHRILKVSRSIADMDGEAMIQPRHLSEAIQYRTLDKRYWQASIAPKGVKGY